MNQRVEKEIIESQPSTEIAVNDATSMMTMMVNAAQHMDTDKLEKLMDLQERILNRNAKSEFAADYVRMKPNLPKVLRSKKNEQTNSKYAPLEDVNQAVDPILEQYGFGTSTKIISQTAESVTVKAELWHRGGHIEETTITMPLDSTGIKGVVNKTLPHATTASVTYAKRVAICALLNISTGDDKDGNTDIAFVSNEQAVEIDLFMVEVKADKAKFLKRMGVDDVRHIRANEYKKAMDLLRIKEKQLKEKGGVA